MPPIDYDTAIYRDVTYEEAAEYWKTSIGTLYSWWAKRESILLNEPRRYNPQWPELEEQLFNAFLVRRERQLPVTVRFFRTESAKLFAALYPDSSSIWNFSAGWFYRFLQRRGITRRRITKQSTRPPADVAKIANNWLKFIKRNTQPIVNTTTSVSPLPSRRTTAYLQLALRSSSPIRSPSPDSSLMNRRFPLHRILNVDETPIPFEYLDGYSYAIKGSKTVAAKSDRSGWNKRQATLIPILFADGAYRLRWILIFHGTPSEEGGRIWKEESHLYAPDIIVKFNNTAYNNEKLFAEWIREELGTLYPGEEILLAMDVARFHCTDSIMTELKSANILPALIPPGMTSYLQPADTHANKWIKDALQVETDIYTAEMEESPGFTWDVSKKRIMTTHVVSAAARRLANNPELIQRAFLHTGISINPDGSENHLISIKDIKPEDIDFTGWEHTEQRDLVVGAGEEVALNDDDIGLELEGDSNQPTFTTQGKKKPELKQMCKDRGLLASGTNKELIERLHFCEAARRDASSSTMG
jgi:SAP domain/DDE superfamily endonuclease